MDSFMHVYIASTFRHAIWSHTALLSIILKAAPILRKN